MTSYILRASVLLTVLVACLLLSGGAAGASSRPNVVLIVGDDHAWPHYGFMGDDVALTPHLDALAAGGTVFRNAHVPSSVCMPSLRALLGGIHTGRWDAERATIASTYGPSPDRQEVPYYRTLPRELARRGYLSWEGGKMWEGTFDQAGFTHGLATAVGGFFTTVGEDFGRTGWLEGTALDPLRGFLDEAGTDPFFLWVAPLLPHAPFDAPAVFREPYEQLGLPPVYVDFYANASWLDAVVGEVVAELTTRGLRENTLLVYLADNGWGITQFYPGVGQGKSTLYELGFRTPLIVNQPGAVSPGVVRDDLVSSLDVMPTILDYAGADQLPDREGRSLKAAIETGAAVGRDRIVSAFTGPGPHNTGAFVRTPTWRYITSEDGREQLYEIAVDPFEQVDVAAAHPELLAEFREDVARWRAEQSQAPEFLDATGIVRDARQAPLAGAELELKGRASDGRLVVLRVLTGRDGGFRFAGLPHGNYTLRAVRRARRLRVGGFTDRIPIRLPLRALGSHLPLVAQTGSSLPGANDATVRGVLQEEDGTPLAGKTVKLRGRGLGKPVSVAVRTSPDGRFAVENLPPGDYRLSGNPDRPLARPVRELTVASGAEVTADLVAVQR